MFESNLAERVTELQWIDRFQSGGRSLFAQSAQNLTIYSNSRSKELVLEAKDTVGDVAQKLRQAIATSALRGGLDMGVDGLINSPTGVDYNTSVFVDNPVAQTDTAVGGTIVLRSSIGGQEGRFFFSGDERLVNGFSWATVKGATFGTMNVSVFDAHSGEWLGDQKVSDGVLRHMLPGVDVAMNGKTDTLITWNAAAGTFNFASGPGKAIQHVHVANNAMTLQVGANPGQSIDALVGEITSSSLELQRLLLVDRDVAEESLAKIDKAVNTVNSQRARIGAYMSRLNTTINILDITKENMSASESRIRDLDVAAETIAYTRNQIMSQAATAVLAQANQLPQTVLTLLR
jgi:flagellin